MKLTTTQDVYQFLNMYISSSALNVALEKGIFWYLSKKPRNASNVAEILNMPIHRCHALLELLCKLGLLDKDDDKYLSSTVARQAILNAYSVDTWAFFAKIAQDHYPLLNDLTLNISHSDSLWNKQEFPPPLDWFDQLNKNPEYAKKFTYGLYELHLSFAEKFAQHFDMTGVKHMMDIGGGSGVMSLELLKRHTHLTATVIDIEHVCIYGREIARKNLVDNRITYTVLDFLKDDLPKGFELIILCDAGIFQVDFFSKLRKSLAPNGCLAIITNIDDDSASLSYPGRKVSLYKSTKHFLSSLESSGKPQRQSTIESVKLSLMKAGFKKIDHDIWESGEVIIQAYK
ncbi:MAG: methyltransferase [Candidatus Hodarchaeales archaeon]